MNPLEIFPHWPSLEEIVKNISSEKRNQTTINAFTAIPYLVFRLAQMNQSICLITDEEKCESTAQDIQSFRAVSGELTNYSIGFISNETPMTTRTLLEESLSSKGLLWVCSIDSLSQTNLLPTKESFLKKRSTLKVGKMAFYSELIQSLSMNGYKRVDFVEDLGEFASRGEIIDFWTPQQEEPTRIIFTHDLIETMHSFDPLTQRTTQFVPEITILPLPSMIGKKESFEGSLFEYFPSQSLILQNCLLKEEKETVSSIFTTILIHPQGNDCNLLPLPKLHLNWKLFKKELEDHQKDGIKDFIFCQNMGESERLEELFDEVDIKPPLKPTHLIAPLSEGFYSPQLKISIWSFADIAGSPPALHRKQKLRLGRSIDSLAQIIPGDYVIHEQYGIGKYRGLEQIRLKLKTKKPSTRFRQSEPEKISEFLAIEYKGGDRLLVPPQDFKFIQKYVSQEGKRPTLYSLDGVAWDNLKQKTQKEIAQLAKELLETAALRGLAARGYKKTAQENYSEQMLKEFQDAFPYEETPDQKIATEQIFRDLDSSELMDRLLCGDVGYGKTEIAMRAAFKSILNSNQVAVLVPTTILTEQHFQNFSQRFACFPVKMGMLSRFQTKTEQAKILFDLKSGFIDLIIGTHRLLQKDVEFKKLGLLIIDEEHRFGVQQKEKLKKFKRDVDILALSATPIPRTLTFALGGARGISMIETAPQGRLSIETHVGMFDEEILKECVLREIKREGQIFYVYNHIKSILKEKERLQMLFPTLKIGIAHGQMNSDELEKAMWLFLHKKWDLLLSTTIIESGLDIPNVNTIIIQDCQEFGLSQLYQLRGRVGRTKTKAYCMLFFSDWANMSEEAQKRLQAIQEFSNLGSGFKLSLRDMEIRGTGELLGARQHGWIHSVGLELYCKLLSDEIRKLKTKHLDTQLESEPTLNFPEIDLELPAYIPDSYIDSPGERIALYKKMVLTKTKEELNSIRNDCEDRFGPFSEPLENLFQVLHLRWTALNLKLKSIQETEEGLLLSWQFLPEGVPIDIEKCAKENPSLIEIQVPSSFKTNEPLLSILFKCDATVPRPTPLDKIIYLLQIAFKYITI